VIDHISSRATLSVTAPYAPVFHPWIVKEYSKTHARAGETNTGGGLCSDFVTNTEWLLPIGGRKDTILELAGQAVEWGNCRALGAGS
jgi:hypothetical protein